MQKINGSIERYESKRTQQSIRAQDISDSFFSYLNTHCGYYGYIEGNCQSQYRSFR